MRSLLLFLWLAPTASAELPPLIPRETLMSAAENLYPQISPDGKRFAWLKPDEKGVTQIWVRSIERASRSAQPPGSDSLRSPIDKEDAKQVSHDPKRPVYEFAWAWDDRTILYLQDSDGDENTHIYAIDLTDDNVRDLTPWQGIRARLLATDPKQPNTILATLNLRDRRLMDVYRIDLRTGASTLDTKNPGDVMQWMADSKLVVRGAGSLAPDGGTILRWRPDGKAAWKELLRAPATEEVQPFDFSADGKSVFMRSSLGADKARLVQRDLATGKETVIAKDDDVDIDRPIIHPIRHLVQAYALDKDVLEWKVLDKSIQSDWEAIGKLSDGVVSNVNIDRADKTWMVEIMSDHGPFQYWIWDRTAKKGTFLFFHRPKLKGLPLQPMKGVTITARDGLKLHGYLTLPPGVPPKNLPFVLNPHGGPWARDTWGYNREAQWLANRGYAVLEINFRGSTGYGKTFLHAGDRQWGKKMHDDLVDAVKWSVAEGIADPKRVAIYGGSYGGYSALAGATFTPDLFKCAIDLFGPSNITTLLHSVPPYWAPLKAMWKVRVGDVDDPKDAEMIKNASPLFSADKIKIPLLIGQGQNDVRVKPAESEQILAAIDKHGGRATYALYSDEGHGFLRPENNIDFCARIEKFLADNLGGRYEPMKGDKYPGANVTIKEVGQKKK